MFETRTGVTVALSFLLVSLASATPEYELDLMAVLPGPTIRYRLNFDNRPDYFTAVEWRFNNATPTAGNSKFFRLMLDGEPAYDFDMDGAFIMYVANGGFTRGPTFIGRRALGITNFPEPVRNGTVLGGIELAGYSAGRHYEDGASIVAIVDGEPTVNGVPAKWQFATSDGSSPIPTPRWEIDSTGNLLPSVSGTVSIGDMAARVHSIYTDKIVCGGGPTVVRRGMGQGAIFALLLALQRCGIIVIE